MEKKNRGDKIYLDKDQKNESSVNSFLDCRDGIVEVYEYADNSGYGLRTRLFLCENTKAESTAIIRQIWNDTIQEWMEEEMHFDSDSFTFLRALITGKNDQIGGKYTLVRHYCQ